MYKASDRFVTVRWFSSYISHVVADEHQSECDCIITYQKSSSQISATSELHFDQTSNTPTLFSINKQSLSLFRVHPRSPYNHPLLSLFALLWSPLGLQAMLHIVHLVVAVINREYAEKKKKKKRQADDQDALP